MGFLKQLFGFCHIIKKPFVLDPVYEILVFFEKFYSQKPPGNPAFLCKRPDFCGKVFNNPLHIPAKRQGFAPLLFFCNPECFFNNFPDPDALNSNSRNYRHSKHPG